LEGHVWDLLAHWVFGSWDMRLICYRFIIRNLVYNNEGWNNIPTPNSGNGGNMGFRRANGYPWAPEGPKLGSFLGLVSRLGSFIAPIGTKGSGGNRHL